MLQLQKTEGNHRQVGVGIDAHTEKVQIRGVFGSGNPRQGTGSSFDPDPKKKSASNFSTLIQNQPYNGSVERTSKRSVDQNSSQLEEEPAPILFPSHFILKSSASKQKPPAPARSPFFNPLNDRPKSKDGSSSRSRGNSINRRNSKNVMFKISPGYFSKLNTKGNDLFVNELDAGPSKRLSTRQCSRIQPQSAFDFELGSTPAATTRLNSQQNPYGRRFPRAANSIQPTQSFSNPTESQAAIAQVRQAQRQNILGHLLDSKLEKTLIATDIEKTSAMSGYSLIKKRKFKEREIEERLMSDKAKSLLNENPMRLIQDIICLRNQLIRQESDERLQQKRSGGSRIQQMMTTIDQTLNQYLFDYGEMANLYKMIDGKKSLASFSSNHLKKDTMTAQSSNLNQFGPPSLEAALGQGIPSSRPEEMALMSSSDFQNEEPTPKRASLFDTILKGAQEMQLPSQIGAPGNNASINTFGQKGSPTNTTQRKVPIPSGNTTERKQWLSESTHRGFKQYQDMELTDENLSKILEDPSVSNKAELISHMLQQSEENLKRLTLQQSPDGKSVTKREKPSKKLAETKQDHVRNDVRQRSKRQKNRDLYSKSLAQDKEEAPQLLVHITNESLSHERSFEGERQSSFEAGGSKFDRPSGEQPKGIRQALKISEPNDRLHLNLNLAKIGKNQSSFQIGGDGKTIDSHHIQSLEKHSSQLRSSKVLSNNSQGQASKNEIRIIQEVQSDPHAVEEEDEKALSIGQDDLPEMHKGQSQGMDQMIDKFGSQKSVVTRERNSPFALDKDALNNLQEDILQQDLSKENDLFEKEHGLLHTDPEQVVEGIEKQQIEITNSQLDDDSADAGSSCQNGISLCVVASPSYDVNSRQKKQEEEQEEFNKFFQGLRGLTPNKSILTAHEKINEKCRRAKEAYKNCLDNIMENLDKMKMHEKHSFKDIPPPNGKLPIFIETQPKTIYSQVGVYNRTAFSPASKETDQSKSRVTDYSRYSFNPQIQVSVLKEKKNSESIAAASRQRSSEKCKSNNEQDASREDSMMSQFNPMPAASQFNQKENPDELTYASVDNRVLSGQGYISFKNMNDVESKYLISQTPGSGMGHHPRLRRDQSRGNDSDRKGSSKITSPNNGSSLRTPLLMTSRVKKAKNEGFQFSALVTHKRRGVKVTFKDPQSNQVVAGLEGKSYQPQAKTHLELLADQIRLSSNEKQHLLKKVAEKINALQIHNSETDKGRSDNFQSTMRKTDTFDKQHSSQVNQETLNMMNPSLLTDNSKGEIETSFKFQNNNQAQAEQIDPLIQGSNITSSKMTKKHISTNRSKSTGRTYQLSRDSYLTRRKSQLKAQLQLISSKANSPKAHHQHFVGGMNGGKSSSPSHSFNLDLPTNQFEGKSKQIVQSPPSSSIPKGSESNCPPSIYNLKPLRLNSHLDNRVASPAKDARLPSNSTVQNTLSNALQNSVQRPFEKDEHSKDPSSPEHQMSSRSFGKNPSLMQVTKALKEFQELENTITAKAGDLKLDSLTSPSSAIEPPTTSKKLATRTMNRRNLNFKLRKTSILTQQLKELQRKKHQESIHIPTETERDVLFSVVAPDQRSTSGQSPPVTQRQANNIEFVPFDLRNDLLQAKRFGVDNVPNTTTHKTMIKIPMNNQLAAKKKKPASQFRFKDASTLKKTNRQGSSEEVLESTAKKGAGQAFVTPTKIATMSKPPSPLPEQIIIQIDDSNESQSIAGDEGLSIVGSKQSQTRKHYHLSTQQAESLASYPQKSVVQLNQINQLGNRNLSLDPMSHLNFIINYRREIGKQLEQQQAAGKRSKSQGRKQRNQFDQNGLLRSSNLQKLNFRRQNMVKRELNFLNVQNKEFIQTYFEQKKQQEQLNQLQAKKDSYMNPSFDKTHNPSRDMQSTLKASITPFESISSTKAKPTPQKSVHLLDLQLGNSYIKNFKALGKRESAAPQSSSPPQDSSQPAIGAIYNKQKIIQEIEKGQLKVNDLISKLSEKRQSELDKIADLYIKEVLGENIK